MAALPEVFLLASLLVIVATTTSADQPVTSHDYCVIGAGPGGLQMSHFLQKAGRDYVTLERSNISGHFFLKYPRHRKLISINKRFTGSKNRLFNERHDWNSLLSDDESLLYKHYSKDFFPHADTMLTYLGDFTRKLNLNVKYNMSVASIDRNNSLPSSSFVLSFENGQNLSCRTVIVATGMWKPRVPKFKGYELTVGYEDVSIDPDDFEGKSVLILGRGNAAFETADVIYGRTNMVHMIGRSRARLSWNTHYVGDLRAVNNGLLDTYQLKSLDGLMEGSVQELAVYMQKDRRLKAAGRFLMREEQYQEYMKSKYATKEEYENFLKLNSSEKPPLVVEESRSDPNKSVAYREFVEDERHSENFPLKHPYDVIIRCLGFRFDYSIFTESTHPGKAPTKSKYPDILHNYEAKRVPGLFFVGTNTHSLDFRKSAGGFIHGFRYTARALHRLLEWKNHNIKWPHRTWPVSEIVNVVAQRVNEAPGLYQMFEVLCDVIYFTSDRREFVTLQEFPLNLLAELTEMTGHEATDVVVLVLEYGLDFSGPGKDTLGEDRATGDPEEAHTSNFLHPVLYYYRHLPSKTKMNDKLPKEVLPRPTRIHHVVEDFHTEWTTPKIHLMHLRRFFEFCIGTDLRNKYSDTCLTETMTRASMSLQCMK